MICQPCYVRGMLVFNHLLAGAAIGVIVPAPLVAPVAFVAHFVMDLFPHAYGEEPPYSRRLKIQVATDVAISLLTIPFVLWLFPPEQWFIIGVGAFFSLFPDLLWLFWRRGGPEWFQRLLDWAHWIQWGERTYGWIFDAFYGFILAFILLALAGKL